MLFELRIQRIQQFLKFFSVKSTVKIIPDDLRVAEAHFSQIGKFVGKTDSTDFCNHILFCSAEDIRKRIVDSFRVVKIIRNKGTDAGRQAGAGHQNQKRTDRQGPRLKDDRILDLTESKYRNLSRGGFARNQIDDKAHPAEHKDRTQNTQNDGVTHSLYLLPGRARNTFFVCRYEAHHAKDEEDCLYRRIAFLSHIIRCIRKKRTHFLTKELERKDQKRCELDCRKSRRSKEHRSPRERSLVAHEADADHLHRHKGD